MGMLLRKQYTMPIPDGAEITERDGARIARWRLRNGQVRTAEVVDCKDGKVRVRGQSKVYSVRYRDGRGQMVEVSTGCKDEVAARSVLVKLERQAELVRSGVFSQEESDVADNIGQPLPKHFDGYEKHLRARGGNPRRIKMVRARLERLAKECRFSKLNRMTADAVEEWLVKQTDAGMGAAARNGYRESLVCFGNWCRRTKRLTTNPFNDLPRADENCDRRHHRRALTVSELMRLLTVASLRPLAEYGREVVHNGLKASKRHRATWTREPLIYETLEAATERAREALRENLDLIANLERTGHERALLYKVLALTGLRKGEIASLTVGQLELKGRVPFVILNPADEKNRQGSDIPLRADLVAEITAWLTERLRDAHVQARKNGLPKPARLPPTTQLFNVPTGLTRIFDRDLEVAGIPKRDERNRVVDVHALRVTFGTHLCAAGVPLRTVQAAMRHSKPELTANIYTDPRLLDIAGAVASLPSLELAQCTGQLQAAAN